NVELLPTMIRLSGFWVPLRVPYLLLTPKRSRSGSSRRSRLEIKVFHSSEQTCSLIVLAGTAYQIRRNLMAALIQTDHLTKSYGRKRGIIDVSFQVEEGEVFGFLGPNGAGKTTTIRVLMALLRANSGTAHIAGLDCWKQSVEIKCMLGYLPGELSLDPKLTGGQILEYFGHLRGGIDQAYLKQLIARLELDPTRKFRQYSSGNKRKIGLIQAFMHRPRLLLLDEPTNGLDPLNQQEFNRMIAEARADG